jgi:hypothetical protein
MTVVRLAGTVTVFPSVAIVGIKRLQKAIPAMVIIRVFIAKDTDEIGGADIQRRGK